MLKLLFIISNSLIELEAYESIASEMKDRLIRRISEVEGDIPVLVQKIHFKREMDFLCRSNPLYHSNKRMYMIKTLNINFLNQMHLKH